MRRTLRLAVTACAVLMFPAATARAQWATPVVVDNRQPSIGLTHFIDAQGFVRMFAGNYVPAGYGALDGGSIFSSTASQYVSAVGSTWGGDGVTSAARPDAVGRTIIGASSESPVGAIVGSSTMTVSQENAPPSLGGSSVPLDNRQPSITMRYAIRTAGNVLPGDYTNGLLSVGAIAAFAGTTLPEGWMYAEGQTLDARMGYAALFSAMGTRFGGDASSGIFRLPDLRNRTPIGATPSGFPIVPEIGDQVGRDAISFNELARATDIHGDEVLLFDNRQASLGLSFHLTVDGAIAPMGDGNCPCARSDVLAPFLGEVTMFGYDRINRSAGQLASVFAYEELYSVIGTRFGGDGESFFVLPNFDGRVVIGAGTSVIDPARTVASGELWRRSYDHYGDVRVPTDEPITVPEPAGEFLLTAGLAICAYRSRRRFRLPTR